MARIQYVRGDIFESKAQVIVNTVNCKGIMGKGLALAFKQKYPDMFSVYKQDCKTGRLHIGRPTLYQKSEPWILNFPTKDDWRQPSKLEYLSKGLEYLVANYEKAGIKSIAFPKLGAQNGKLLWDEVGPLMARYLSQIDIDVYIYITEEDREYYEENYKDNNTNVWQHFSELALSLERLCSEVSLSPREAKKVFEARRNNELVSLSNVEAIEGLAKISLKRIKDYVCHKQYTEQKLLNLEDNIDVTKRQKKKVSSSTRKRKSSSENIESPTISLFPSQLHEMLS